MGGQSGENERTLFKQTGVSLLRIKRRRSVHRPDGNELDKEQRMSVPRHREETPGGQTETSESNRGREGRSETVWLKGKESVTV